MRSQTKKFIAGAICPICKSSDTIHASITEEFMISTCVECQNVENLALNPSLETSQKSMPRQQVNTNIELIKLIEK